MRKIMLGLIAIMFLFVAGCAVEDTHDDGAMDDDHSDDTSSGSTDAVVETPPADETGESMDDAEETVVVAEGEVSVTGNAMDPDTLTVSKGATITFVAVDGPHLLSDNGQRFSGRMNSGERVDHTFDEVGERKVYDAILKGVLVVTVTE